MELIKIEELEIEFQQKKVKNINLSIVPPEGKIRVSAPYRVSMAQVHRFLEEKKEWIRFHRQKVLHRAKNQKDSEPDFVTGDTLYFFGEKILLEVLHVGKKKVSFMNGRLILQVPADASVEVRKKAIENWYREQLRREIPPLFERWEIQMGVKADDWSIRNMKTRWGSCNTRDKKIWLNLQLVKKPIECLEYVIVHELAHLLERNHNHIFYGHMDRFLPDWKETREKLAGREIG